MCVQSWSRCWLYGPSHSKISNLRTWTAYVIHIMTPNCVAQIYLIGFFGIFLLFFKPTRWKCFVFCHDVPMNSKNHELWQHFCLSMLHEAVTLFMDNPDLHFSFTPFLIQLVLRRLQTPMLDKCKFRRFLLPQIFALEISILNVQFTPVSAAEMMNCELHIDDDCLRSSNVGKAKWNSD